MQLRLLKSGRVLTSTNPFCGANVGARRLSSCTNRWCWDVIVASRVHRLSDSHEIGDATAHLYRTAVSSSIDVSQLRRSNAPDGSQLDARRGMLSALLRRETRIKQDCISLLPAACTGGCCVMNGLCPAFSAHVEFRFCCHCPLPLPHPKTFPDTRFRTDIRWTSSRASPHFFTQRRPPR